MMTRTLICLVLALTFITSCDNAPTNTITSTPTTHNELSFGLPDGRDVKPEDDKIVLIKKEKVRGIDEIVIWTVAPPPLPKGDFIKSTSPAPHTVVTIEGGMSGPEYALSIPKHLKNRDVTVRAYLQSDSANPAFTEAWAVWDSLKEVD